MSEQAVYKTWDDFVYEDVTRWTSQRLSYGRMWRDTSGVLWHMAYIRATGEAFVVRSTDPTGEVTVIAVVTPDEEHDGGGPWYRTFDHLLGNYTDPYVNGSFSLAWLKERLQPGPSPAEREERR